LEKEFKVGVFDIEVEGSNPLPFSQAIEKAWGTSLENRVKNVNRKERRLEHYEERNGCLLLNLVTLDFPGPGRSRPDTSAVSINLEPDELFSQETAMLYDPEEKLAFVESTLAGMGHGAIAHYFSSFANSMTQYQLIPRLDEEAATRARRHRVIRSLTMRVALGPATKADREAGINVFEALGEEYGARFIDIEIKAGTERTSSLVRNKIQNLIPRLLAASKEGKITHLKLKGKEHDDDALELIDLIQHREKRVRSLLVSPDERKSYTKIAGMPLSKSGGNFLIDAGHL